MQYFVERNRVAAVQYTGDNLKEVNEFLDYHDLSAQKYAEGDYLIIENSGMAIRRSEWLIGEGYQDFRTYTDEQFRRYFTPWEEGDELEAIKWNFGMPEYEKMVLLRIKKNDDEDDCYEDVGYLSEEDGEYYYNSKPYVKDFFYVEVIAWCEIPK